MSMSMSLPKSLSRSRISVDDLARRVAGAGADRRGFLAVVAAVAAVPIAAVPVGARRRLARGPQGRNHGAAALRATGEPVSRPHDGDGAAGRGVDDSDASTSKKRCAKEGKSCARKACCSWYVCLAGTCTVEPAWKNTSEFGLDTQDEADRLDQPNAVFVDPSERRAWVVDGGNNRIAIWQRTEVDPNFWVSAADFGSLGSGPDQFDFPTCVDLTADLRTLVVADVNNDRVSVWTADSPDGLSWSPHSTFGTAGSGPDGLLSPFGARISGDGLTAWVADTGNNRISTWTRSGPASTDWAPLGAFGVAGDGVGEFLAPNDLVVSADGLAIYVADLLNDRTSVWTRQDADSQAWTNVASFGTAGSLPDGIFVSANQLVAWMAESGNNRVTMWSRADIDTERWELVSSFGSAGNVAGEMQAPDGVWFSADGQTGWVADRLNNRMSVWQAVEGRAGRRRKA